MSVRAGNQCDVDVLVIGAGIAGLAAARSLAESGLRVLVLEAEDRVGGRILTVRAGDEVVELGAEFVHGRPRELLALIEEAGLHLVEREGTTAHFQDGQLTLEEEDGEDADQVADPFMVLEDLRQYTGTDVSFAEFVEQKKLSEEAREAAIGFVEGFNAADHCVISIAALGLQQQAEDAIEGDRAFHIAGGYDQLPKFLAAKVLEADGQIVLNTRVDRLEWRTGKVIATSGDAESERSFSARRVVVALPLTVLQRGAPGFVPPLPHSIREILFAEGPIRMGHALRFTIIFKEPFWKDFPPQPQLRNLSFLFTPGMVPPVWWTPHPEASNAVTGWVGGPQTSALEGLSTEALAERACNAPAEILDADVQHIRDLLIGCYMHDWSSDPWAAGAYSYIAKGGVEAPAIFGKAINGTIYFAGEHTTTDGHWGTVHAALSSGLRVAAQIATEPKA